MLTMDGTATLGIWRPQESQFNNVAGLTDGFALNKLYVAKSYKPNRYHRRPLRHKGRSLHPSSTAVPRISKDARLWLRRLMLRGRLTIAQSSPSLAGQGAFAY